MAYVSQGYVDSRSQCKETFLAYSILIRLKQNFFGFQVHEQEQSHHVQKNSLCGVKAFYRGG